MGCSASRSNAFITSSDSQQQQPSSSHSSSSFSDASSTPVSRTLSLPTPLVHHPPIHKGDTNHLVSLTSTTYGSLVLVDPKRQDLLANLSTTQMGKPQEFDDPKDPLSPDSVINTWELMEGLDEDEFDFHVVKNPLKDLLVSDSMVSGDKIGSFVRRLEVDADEIEESYEIVEHKDTKPLWKHLSEESMLAKMDPDVVLSYQKALLTKKGGGSKESKQFIKSKTMSAIDLNHKDSDDLFKSSGSRSMESNTKDLVKSPISNTIRSTELKNEDSEGLLRSPAVLLEDSNKEVSGGLLYSDKVTTKVSNDRNSLSLVDDGVCLSGVDDRIVLYFTSLRGIRKTYEDCCAVRAIFRGFRVCVDERDISMDSSYRTELQSLLGGKAVCLPQVFIRGKHIGGAEEIKQLNEDGELSKLLQGFKVTDTGYICESCGDARFIPCPNCNGSRKVFEEEDGILRRCPDCNENGLIRCLSCCP